MRRQHSLPALLILLTLLPLCTAAMQEEPAPFEADLHAAQQAAELGDAEKAMALTDPWLAQAEKQKDLDFMLVMQLDVVANALRKAERYAESERIHSRLLAAAEKLQNEGVAGLQVKGLAEGYMAQKKFAEAEPLLRRLLASQEATYGDPNHPRLAVPSYDLAEVLRLQGKTAEAESLYRRSLKLVEAAVGADDPNITPPLDGLADSLKLQGKSDEAETLFKRSWAIMKQVAGETADTALKVANLADFYRYTKKYPEAEPLFESAIAMYEKTAPADKGLPRVLDNYAALMRATQRPQQAETLEARARDLRAAPPEIGEMSAALPANEPRAEPESALAAPIFAIEKALDAGDFAGAEKQLAPLLEQAGAPGMTLDALGLLPLAERFESLGRIEVAERIAQRVLELMEQTGGPTNPFLLPAIDRLAQIYKQQKRWADAEPLLKRALAVTETAYREEGMSDENPRVFSAIEALAELYMAAGRYPDAEAMYRRMIAAMEKFYGKDAPMLDLVWTRLGDAARAQQRYADAEAAYQRAIAASGKDNPFRDAALVGLAETFSAQGKYKDAEPLYQQAMAAQEEVLGPENPDLIGTLEKYAALLRATNRPAEAAKLEARAKKLKEASEGKRR